LEQVIRLEPDTQIEHVRARIEWAGSNRVIVVVPRQCHALDDRFELELLRRWGEDAGIAIALVVSDLDIQEKAAEAGLPVFGSVRQAQRARWKWKAPYEPPKLVARPDGNGLEPTVWTRDWLRVTRWQIAGTLVLFVLSVAVLGLGVVLLVPSASVKIIPRSQPVYLSTEIEANPTANVIDYENGVIPARNLSRPISGTMSLATTATKQLPDTRATGAVVFTNLRPEETIVPTDTIVATSAGVTLRFHVAATDVITIPAGFGQRVEVPITATDPGPAGNVHENMINVVEGPLALSARVINLTPTTGGALKDVHIVTAADKKELRTRLLDKLKQDGLQLLQGDLSPLEFIPVESVEIDETNESFDHHVDDPTDSLNLHVEATVSALALDYGRLQDFARTVLDSQVPGGYELLPAGVSVQPAEHARVQGASVALNIRAVGYATPVVDRKDLIRRLQGQSVERLDEIVAADLSLAQPPTLEISPPWWPWMPWLGFRIALFVEPEQVK
jgi:hypothetical protein